VKEVERSATTFDEAGSFRWSGRVAESPFVQEVERSATIFDEVGSFRLSDEDGDTLFEMKRTIDHHIR
jgi:hypothetical protein